jgi:hypothetical protein
MLNLKRRYEERWETALEPIRHGEVDAEAFDAWWSRNGRKRAAVLSITHNFLREIDILC